MSTVDDARNKLMTVAARRNELERARRVLGQKLAGPWPPANPENLVLSQARTILMLCHHIGRLEEIYPEVRKG